MRRISCRELSGVMVASSPSGSWTKELSANKLQWSKQACRALYGPRRESRLCSARVDRHFCSSTVPYRQYCKSTDHDKGHLGISVVGTPDPITWIRNKIILALTELYFDLDFSVEFDHGVKQAVFQVSTMVSKGRFEELMGLMSEEAVADVRRRYNTLTEVQRRHLAISLDDIVFLLPEDVSVVFDSRGRKFCSIIMRLWHLTSADVPEDPESTRIFKVDPGLVDGPPKKIITAVYEFHRELTAGANPDWMVTHVWHWKQLE
ncbi:m-AAA protease-interacting protein 1, mitochondrial [Colossoma macropomum]|uniref:m-AAA protease-interacting protein 1, mitochondrial n=1 Tax=Colossoma macropomum TaxID=42526 RepID=UPI001865151E|nr:m-AAA protease-interacting protein 1, mitochondrial [Colossoma macropomum]